MATMIAPSMLSANFGQLDREIEMVNRSEASLFHLDVMDGLFVPNISYGFPIIEAIAKGAEKPLDAHLMIVEPERYFEKFAELGVDYLSIHWEASTHLHRSITRIKELGMKAGVALNPHTPVSLLSDILEELNFVLIMSVNPGFGGQGFIEKSYHKIRELKKMIEERSLDTLIEVDGGVTPQNAPLLVECGADMLVAGSAIFSAESPIETISQMAKL